MKIAARVSNTVSGHALEGETDGRKQSIAVSPKAAGRGSSVNGGELLFAALATCFCNDLYREAAKRGIKVRDVNVEVTGTFGNPDGQDSHFVTRSLALVSIWVEIGQPLHILGVCFQRAFAARAQPLREKHRECGRSLGHSGTAF